MLVPSAQGLGEWRQGDLEINPSSADHKLQGHVLAGCPGPCPERL